MTSSFEPEWLTEWSENQLCPTLCNPMDCSPMDCSLPGSSVYGILWARILERVAIPISRGSSQPRDQTQVSTLQADSLPAEPPGKPKNTGLTEGLVPFAQLEKSRREKSLVERWLIPLWTCWICDSHGTKRWKCSRGVRSHQPLFCLSEVLSHKSYQLP